MACGIRTKTGHQMPNIMNINAFDAEFASRTSVHDWQRILSVRDHPGFLDGLASYNDLISNHFAGNPILNRVVVEESRFQLIVYTLHLYDTFDPAEPTSGLTHSRLQKLALTHDLASPGGVTAYLGLSLIHI